MRVACELARERPRVDHPVDRPQLQGLKNLQVSGTNGRSLDHTDHKPIKASQTLHLVCGAHQNRTLRLSQTNEASDHNKPDFHIAKTQAECCVRRRQTKRRIDNQITRPATPNPGAEGGPKGWAVRPLKWHASWVQTGVSQVGPYLPWAQQL